MTELIAGKKISEFPELTNLLEVAEVLIPVLDINLQNRRMRGRSLLEAVPEATTSGKGKVRLSGDLGGTADAPTVPRLEEKADLTSPEFLGRPLVPTAASGVSTTQAASTKFVQTAIATNRSPDATSTVKGIVKLTNDLGGTADEPTVPGLSCKAPIESPRFRGIAEVPTPENDDIETQIINVLYLNRKLNTLEILDATPEIKGKLKLSGDLGGTAAAPTVPGLADKAPLAFPSFTGIVKVPTPENNVIPTAAVNIEYLENAIADIGLSDATPIEKGVLRLAGDLEGTAEYPRVPALTGKASINSPEFTGIVQVPTPQDGSILAQAVNIQYLGLALDAFTTPDASADVKGKIQLAGDLSGTASEPTVPELANKAPLNSPQLTGIPLAPTPSVDSIDNRVATTLFVNNLISNVRRGSFSKHIENPVSKVYYLQWRAPYPYYIKSFSVTTLTGSCFLRFKINDVEFSQVQVAAGTPVYRESSNGWSLNRGNSLTMEVMQNSQVLADLLLTIETYQD